MKNIRDPQIYSRFKEVSKAHVPAVKIKLAPTTKVIWAKLKTVLLGMQNNLISPVVK